MAAKNIKTLIFDLGGVIINLDPNATLRALEALVNLTDGTSPADLEHEIFLQYERGEIDDAAFRKAVGKVYKFEAHITDEHADEAWNKMLLDIPIQRIELLRSLR